MAAPWHAAYPAPEHQPESLTREEVLESMKEVSCVAKQDFVLIDLRRNDHEVSLALLPFGIYLVRSQCR
jgi:arsenical-resistance protein 2